MSDDLEEDEEAFEPVETHHEVKPTPETPLPLFNLETSQSDLETWMSAIETIDSEPTFTVSSSGLTVNRMDPSRVAMVVTSRPAVSFQNYGCEREGQLCIDLTTLLKILGRFDKKDTVTLQLNKEAKLDVKAKDRTFRVSTLEPGGEEIPTPKVTFTATVKLTSEGLFNAIQDAVVASDHVKIKVDVQTYFKAAGNVMDAEIELKRENEMVLEINAQKPTTASFSLSYLNEIAKIGKNLSDTVTLSLADNMPIKLEYGDAGNTTFYLAPRIEAD